MKKELNDIKQIIQSKTHIEDNHIRSNVRKFTSANKRNPVLRLKIKKI